MVVLFRFLFVCGILLAVVACGLIGVTIWHFDHELPDYQQLAHYQPVITTRVHAADGRVLAEFAAEPRGYTATRHQREAGTGYFDLVTQAIAPQAETVALAGSTEADQFATAH